MTYCQQARQMLQDAGLKVSMGRLKIIEMLLHCGDRLSCQRIHRLLLESGAPLSLFSVRQTLKRMEQGGVLINTSGDSYQLAEVDFHRVRHVATQGSLARRSG
jgi:Fur family ferric uptake transcriptional regulator